MRKNTTDQHRRLLNIIYSKNLTILLSIFLLFVTRGDGFSLKTPSCGMASSAKLLLEPYSSPLKKNRDLFVSIFNKKKQQNNVENIL